MQPHIHLERSLNITYAILPGDPARVERISAYLDQPQDLGCNREYRCISGTFRGVRVLVISTGMGGPSTAIAVEELRRIGVTHMIRIGSCGALQPEIRIGDLILAHGAVRDDGTSSSYVSSSYPAVSDSDMLFLCQEAASKNNIITHTGIVRSHDSFYIDEQDAINEYWHGKGVLGSDMETATLLTTARLRGVKALSILNNVVLWGDDTFDSIGSYAEGENSSAIGEKASILLALETFVAIDQKNKRV